MNPRANQRLHTAVFSLRLFGHDHDLRPELLAEFYDARNTRARIRAPFTVSAKTRQKIESQVRAWGRVENWNAVLAA